MKLRKFNRRGAEEFQKLLSEIKSTGKFTKRDLATDKYSEVIDSDIELDENLDFDNRFQFGKYLNEKLSEYEREDLLQMDKLWTFLAYHWLESFVGSIENPKIYSNEKYICRKQEGWDIYYRHFVLFPYYAYSLHEKYSKQFLYPDLDTVGDYAETFASRQQIFNDREMVKVLDNLYYDKDRGRPKKGCTDTDLERPGITRRFVSVMKQLRRNYDLAGMSQDEIESILPAEFEKFPPDDDFLSDESKEEPAEEEDGKSLMDKLGL